MLKFHNIRVVELDKFVYSHKHSLLPEMFNTLFSLSSPFMSTINEMFMLINYSSVEQKQNNFPLNLARTEVFFNSKMVISLTQSLYPLLNQNLKITSCKTIELFVTTFINSDHS